MTSSPASTASLPAPVSPPLVRPDHPALRSTRAVHRTLDTSDVRYQLAGRTDGARRLYDDEEGAATAEYAIVIMAGVILAGVLVAIMKSGDVQAMLLDIVQRSFGAA